MKRRQRRGERARIMSSREIGSSTKSIEQTEYDVSTSSNQHQHHKRKKLEKVQSTYLLFLPQAPSEHLLLLLHRK